MEKNKFFNKYRLNVEDKKASLLSKSLLWMSLGLLVIILVSWISSINNDFLFLAVKLSSGNLWIVSWLINIALIFALYFTISNQKINIIVPIMLYILFSLYEGFFITTLLVFSGSVDIVKDLLLYMLIPASMFLIMGGLGYLNLIDFTKLAPFTMFAFIGLLILSLVMFLTNSFVVEMVYLLLAITVFVIWIGIDMQIIFKSQEQMSFVDKKMMNRISFLFGVRLFIDFVNLLTLIIRLFRN